MHLQVKLSHKKSNKTYGSSGYKNNFFSSPGHGKIKKHFFMLEHYF